MNQPAFTFSPQVKYLKPHYPATSTHRLPLVNGIRPATEPVTEKSGRPVLHLPKVQA